MNMFAIFFVVAVSFILYYKFKPNGPAVSCSYKGIQGSAGLEKETQSQEGITDVENQLWLGEGNRVYALRQDEMDTRFLNAQM